MQDTPKETYCTAKETYFHRKRDLFTQEKRPIYTTKEAYLHSKRDLVVQQKIKQTHLDLIINGAILHPFIEAYIHL